MACQHGCGVATRNREVKAVIGVLLLKLATVAADRTGRTDSVPTPIRVVSDPRLPPPTSDLFPRPCQTTNHNVAKTGLGGNVTRIDKCVKPLQAYSKRPVSCVL